MRNIPHGINVFLNRSFAAVAPVMLAVILCLPTRAVRADITNIIWQAKLTGKMAIQQYDAKLVPRMSTAKFTTSSFISMVGGSAGATTIGSTTIGTSTSAGDVLGVNFVMAGGQTNFYLSLYDRTNRKNTLRITTNEVMTLVSDGTNLTFTVEAPLIPTSNTWGGGFLRIAGTGHIVKGVPAALNGAVEGVFIDNRPGDLNGTTGLVLQAKISTLNVPLRVLPPD